MGATTRTYFAAVRPTGARPRVFCKITDDIDCVPPDAFDLVCYEGMPAPLLREIADLFATTYDAAVDVDTIELNYSVGY